MGRGPWRSCPGRTWRDPGEPGCSGSRALLIHPPATRRELRAERIEADLVVVGGGVAGVCCAITAARAGLRVALVQDRPVLGGNASSEVRLWVLGATAHMGNNNRWAREGGVVNEILVENQYRNPEGNPLIFDTILLEKATEEPLIRLLLNTAAYEVEKREADTIASVTAFCSQNSTRYVLAAPLFCDASGDGIVGFLSGAAFRMGAEAADEFGEKFAPDQAYGELLGHSMYFYSKDVGRPVRYVPPSFALRDVSVIPRYRAFDDKTHGCRLWWIEYGGRMDTVHDTEAIKWELWRVVYSVWDHIKNSGQFPEAANLTLEWVSTIPGKRESRRFEGDCILTQRDLIEQTRFEDAVSFGGWGIDLHPADGVYSPLPGCTQWHARGIYAIPYRCLYSRNITNLFLAGRIISASHVAFGSTRVIGTCANSAQAVGLAAAMCREEGLLPAELVAPERLRRLQRELFRTGQHIPGCQPDDPDDLARRAGITATSEFRLGALPPDGPPLPLSAPRAQMLPVQAGPLPWVSVPVDVSAPTTLRLELRRCPQADHHTPDLLLASAEAELQPGDGQLVTFPHGGSVAEPCYVFACLDADPDVSVRGSSFRATGVLSVARRYEQASPTEIGVEQFWIWTPTRRPAGQNLAVTVDPPLAAFAPSNVTNGLARPTCGPNAWVADPDDHAPALTLTWPAPVTIGRVELTFDTDWDHPMESCLMGHPEAAMPSCVRHYRLRDVAGNVVFECLDNHQTRNSVRLAPPLVTHRLTVEVVASQGGVPAAIFEVRCYGA
ncbi:MAG: FAD-dependent oxidoreductase [Armatimonadetes bacterium]|nr:FAD-dependent oxidoreductase [Armatimonadota bacterium]